MANIAFVSDKERKEGFTHVVLILTGSVASIKAPLIVSELSAVSIQSICAQELRANIANIIQYDKVKIEVVATKASLTFFKVADIVAAGARVWQDGDEWLVRHLAIVLSD